MGIYICEKCGCVDNTACGGNYLVSKESKHKYKDEYANTHSLCIECTPVEYSDGSINRKAGKWHDMFEKKHWSQYGIKEELIAECKKNKGNFMNAIKYFDNIEKNQ